MSAEIDELRSQVNEQIADRPPHAESSSSLASELSSAGSDYSEDENDKTLVSRMILQPLIYLAHTVGAYSLTQRPPDFDTFASILPHYHLPPISDVTPRIILDTQALQRRFKSGKMTKQDIIVQLLWHIEKGSYEHTGRREHSPCDCPTCELGKLLKVKLFKINRQAIQTYHVSFLDLTFSRVHLRRLAGNEHTNKGFPR